MKNRSHGDPKALWGLTGWMGKEGGGDEGGGGFSLFGVQDRLFDCSDLFFAILFRVISCWVILDPWVVVV